MKECFMFQWGVCFSDGGGFVFKWRGGMGGIGFGAGGLKTVIRWGAHHSHAPLTMGNPVLMPQKILQKVYSDEPCKT